MGRTRVLQVPLWVLLDAGRRDGRWGRGPGPGGGRRQGPAEGRGTPLSCPTRIGVHTQHPFRHGGAGHRIRQSGRPPTHHRKVAVFPGGEKAGVKPKHKPALHRRHPPLTIGKRKRFARQNPCKVRWGGGVGVQRSRRTRGKDRGRVGESTKDGRDGGLNTTLCGQDGGTGRGPWEGTGEVDLGGAFAPQGRAMGTRGTTAGEEQQHLFFVRFRRRRVGGRAGRVLPRGPPRRKERRGDGHRGRKWKATNRKSTA